MRFAKLAYENSLKVACGHGLKQACESANKPPDCAQRILDATAKVDVKDLAAEINRIPSWLKVLKYALNGIEKRVPVMLLQNQLNFAQHTCQSQVLKLKSSLAQYQGHVHVLRGAEGPKIASV